MKIFDCFMYLDEDVVLDLRLNYLNNYIDKFVIVESKFTHSGEKRELNFDIKNFEKFKEKIIYLVLDHEPTDIQKINDGDFRQDLFHRINVFPITVPPLRDRKEDIKDEEKEQSSSLGSLGLKPKPAH